MKTNATCQSEQSPRLPVGQGRLPTVLLLVIVFSILQLSSSAQEPNWKKVSVLIYTKNGKGYVHDNIPNAIACIQKLGTQYGFQADATDDPSKFTNDNLKKYTVIIFANTNNDVFDTDEQRLAMRKFVEAGGGVVGIHCALGTERNWDWFKMMLGGSFLWHPPFQKYRIKVLDAKHPSLAGMPTVWEKEDECYFVKEMYPGIRPIMAHDLSTLDQKDKEKITASAGPYEKLFPAVWYQKFDGGTVWITALGHDKSNYEEPVYVGHILNGLKFVVNQTGKLDYSKAYAKTRDDGLVY